jgi:hypothetical protein
MKSLFIRNKNQRKSLTNFFGDSEFVKLVIQFSHELGVDITNGTACFKDVNNCLNTNIYSKLETSGGQSSNLY